MLTPSATKLTFFTPVPTAKTQLFIHNTTQHPKLVPKLSRDVLNAKICILYMKTDPEVIKLFPCSTQMSKKIILLINVKMPTIVGILTFICMINTTSERLKARNFICLYFNFYEQLKFCAQSSYARKKFYNLGAWTMHTTCHRYYPLAVLCLTSRHNGYETSINNINIQQRIRLVNPFMLNKIPLSIGPAHFHFKGCWMVFFHFNSNLGKTICKPTVETLIKI